MKIWRTGLGVAGILLASFGVFRLITEISGANLLVLLAWLAVALIIHDAVLSPSVVGVGWLLRRCVTDRGRRHLQLGLIIGGMVTVIALPLIALRGSQPPAKALLLQSYGVNLLLIIACIVVFTAVHYLVQVVRDRRRAVRGA